MAKMKAAASTATASNSGEKTSGYFRRLFKENPKLLFTKSNAELLGRWLTDHPGNSEVPQNIKNNLANLKSVLRKKSRKRGRPKKVAEAAPAEAVSVAVMKPARIALKSLEALEEQIDECLTLARGLDREGLMDVIRLLRKARNDVVWKLGQ